MSLALLRDDIQSARERIAPHVRRTPLERSDWLSDLVGGDVYMKLENFQITGSFKVRGAFNKLIARADEVREHGVVVASSGNHGAACAHAARELGIAVEVFVPMSASDAKRKKILAAGARLVVEGDDCVEAERAARAAALSSGRCYVSPYNDLDVIAGQGTIAAEIDDDLTDLDEVFVALGGGGLSAGMASWWREQEAQVRVTAVSPERSPALHRCLEAGAWRDVPCHDTLSDGTAGGLEEGSVTLPLALAHLDDSILVSEDEIAAAMRGFFDAHPMMIEGAAGTALAGVIQQAERLAGQRTVVVLCGANLSPATLQRILASAP